MDHIKYVYAYYTNKNKRKGGEDIMLGNWIEFSSS